MKYQGSMEDDGPPYNFLMPDEAQALKRSRDWWRTYGVIVTVLLVAAVCLLLR
jgi:hypothetical protein